MRSGSASLHSKPRSSRSAASSTTAVFPHLHRRAAMFTISSASRVGTTTTMRAPRRRRAPPAPPPHGRRRARRTTPGPPRRRGRPRSPGVALRPHQRGRVPQHPVLAEQRVEVPLGTPNLGPPAGAGGHGQITPGELGQIPGARLAAGADHLIDPLEQTIVDRYEYLGHAPRISGYLDDEETYPDSRSSSSRPPPWTGERGRPHRRL